ncbi:MAG: tRNA 2-thiouridine(34) synthase MnmA, partial [Candidatus Cloacimonetes bacterium]|nr:tRNA 2-thiouridine(34) synthase MnmA [Candidatus Cloacimonadota bacterium]
TGHYARVHHDTHHNTYHLLKGSDPKKDQSYVLYNLTQNILSKVLFPLGHLAKAEVREIAKKQGFLNANKPDSQDICFVPDGDYAGFISRYTGDSFLAGDFLDIYGKSIGKHRGIVHYTIGQRKGLGMAFNKPMFVCKKNIKNNTVTLCEDKDLYANSLVANDISFVNLPPSPPLHCKAKIRYNQIEDSVTVTAISDTEMWLTFDKPQRAIASGQAVVLYDGEEIIGGGTISGVI